jgi:hypothetical protein
VKRRLAFYGGLVFLLVLFGVYATAMPGTSYRGPWAETSLEEKILHSALEAHVIALSDTIGERRAGNADSLTRAKDYMLSAIRKVPNIRDSQIRLEDTGEDGYHTELDPAERV